MSFFSLLKPANILHLLHQINIPPSSLVMLGRLYAALTSPPSSGSLPSSPDWADFWPSLIEGSIQASIMWLMDRYLHRLTAFQVSLWSGMHVIRFGSAIYEGFSDGWSGPSMAEIYGRTIVVLGFTMTMYTTYHREGGRCSWPVFLSCGTGRLIHRCINVGNHRPTRSQQVGAQST